MTSQFLSPAVASCATESIISRLSVAGERFMTPESRKKPHGIAAWPEEERPRERLLSRGPQALTDAEVIAILIRVGFQGTNAVELGRQLLQRFGSLRAMAEAPVTALLDVKGLKGAKAAQLLAAMEIARHVAVPAQR